MIADDGSEQWQPSRRSSRRQYGSQVQNEEEDETPCSTRALKPSAQKSWVAKQSERQSSGDSALWTPTLDGGDQSGAGGAAGRSGSGEREQRARERGGERDDGSEGA